MLQNKKWLLALVVSVGLILSACTTHKKLPRGADVVDPNGMRGAPVAVETYTEGVGNGAEGEGYVLSSKCRPGKSIPGADQHYFFDFDSSDVRSDAISSIQMQANYLLKHSTKKVRLEGNTDDVGSREYNIALGERRARAVLEVLKQYGVSSSQVTLVSFGAEKPVAGGDDEKSKQYNRRVDLIYTAD